MSRGCRGRSEPRCPRRPLHPLTYPVRLVAAHEDALVLPLPPPVPRPLGPGFHAHQVRDALGLVRLLFAIEREGTDITRAADLTDIGRTLGECLGLAQRSPETLGYRAAVHRSCDAVNKLAAMDWPAEIAEVVRVAQVRVKDQQDRKLDRRDEKKAAVQGRG